VTVTVPTPPGDPTTLKCQCASLWSHPAAELLLGPALRPGGIALTTRLLACCGLRPGSLVLDVGCGPGATLGAIVARGHRGIGVDYSHTLARTAASADAMTIVGDAELLPIRDAAADAVVIECVLSALPDKPRAVDELRRVARPSGVLVLTDVTVTAACPDPLNTALAWVGCASGALRVAGYHKLLDVHGFELTSSEDRSSDLAAMVAQASRRLALLRGAAAVGIMPPLDELIGPELTALATTVLGHRDVDDGGRRILAQVNDALTDGTIGYLAVTATRRA
jgi:arsenite methyltransferase